MAIVLLGRESFSPREDGYLSPEMTFHQGCCFPRDNVSPRRISQIQRAMNKRRNTKDLHDIVNTCRKSRFSQTIIICFNNFLAKIWSPNGLLNHNMRHICLLSLAHSHSAQSYIDSIKMVVMLRSLCKYVSVLMLWVNHSNLFWNVVKTSSHQKCREFNMQQFNHVALDGPKLFNAKTS